MNFIERSKVQLTTAIIAAVFVIGVIIADTTWKVNVARDIREIRAAQQTFTWQRDDMETWVSRTERINYLSGWRGADVAPH
jgi:cell division protein FtsL